MAVVEQEVERVLLDRRGMAKAISVSLSTFERLRKLGMPMVRLPGGYKPLFDPRDVKCWVVDYSFAVDPVSDVSARSRADAAIGMSGR